MKRQYKNIAKLVHDSRIKKGLSQPDLANLLGYLNGQMISNVERAICSIPWGRIVKLSELIDVPPVIIIEAMVNDYQENLKRVCNKDGGLRV